MRIAFISNTSWGLFNFRKGFIKRLISDGHDVVAIAPRDEYSILLQSLGLEYRSIEIDNKGTNPIRDLGFLFRLIALFKREKIDLVIPYTIKPVIYGSLACRILDIPVIAVITGLGTAFLKESFLTRMVESLYFIALKQIRWVFFLNDDDKTLFVERGLVDASIASRIPGEGIDLVHFYPRTPLEDKAGTHFLFAGRLLRDKGLIEYVEAARIVRRRNPTVRFSLLGFIGVANKSAVTIDEVNTWVQEGVVSYLGSALDVRSHIECADCFVLPSYREGISRALLEAMALARPVIATDVVGCRELVDDGANGFLCQPRDVESLVRAMERFSEMDYCSRKEMGLKGRSIVSNKFSESVVIDSYLEKIAIIQFDQKRVTNGA